jgi:hypothetical protein
MYRYYPDIDLPNNQHSPGSYMAIKTQAISWAGDVAQEMSPQGFK